MASNNKSLPAHATELWELVVAYLKQETVEPIKELGRYLKFGLMGGVLIALGLPLLDLALLRALQSETGEHLTGNWSWVPYVAALTLSAVFAGLAVWGMSRSGRRDGRS